MATNCTRREAIAGMMASLPSAAAIAAALTPDYMARLPKDIFNHDADLHYARQGDGYLLYSVGDNGKDNGGQRRPSSGWSGSGSEGNMTYTDGEGNVLNGNPQDWDDIAIQMPAKGKQ
jgi:hypothetical protein